MPVYLFTLHAYATHLPDHPSGSHHWKRGFQMPDAALAERYRTKQRERTAFLTERVQRLLLDESVKAARLQGWRLLGLAFDVTHLHLIASWKSAAKEARRIRAGIKSSFTRRLNRDIGRRTWFSQQGACTRVDDEKHLEFLLEEYLPEHRGLQWYEES